MVARGRALGTDRDTGEPRKELEVVGPETRFRLWEPGLGGFSEMPRSLNFLSKTVGSL